MSPAQEQHNREQAEKQRMQDRKKWSSFIGEVDLWHYHQMATTSNTVHGELERTHKSKQQTNLATMPANLPDIVQPALPTTVVQQTNLATMPANLPGIVQPALPTTVVPVWSVRPVYSTKTNRARYLEVTAAESFDGAWHEGKHMRRVWYPLCENYCLTCKEGVVYDGNTGCDCDASIHHVQFRFTKRDETGSMKWDVEPPASSDHQLFDKEQAELKELVGNHVCSQNDFFVDWVNKTGCSYSKRAMLPTTSGDFSNPHSGESEADLMDVTRRDKTLWGVQDIDRTKFACFDVLDVLELRRANSCYLPDKALIKYKEGPNGAHTESFFFPPHGISQGDWKAWCESNSPRRRIYLDKTRWDARDGKGNTKTEKKEALSRKHTMQLIYGGPCFPISKMTDGEDISATNIVMLSSVCSGSGVPQESLPPLGTQVPNVPQKISPKKEMKALHIPGKTVELEMTPLKKKIQIGNADLNRS